MKFRVGLLLLAVYTRVACGQAAVDALRQSFKGKQFFLRDYSADLLTHYTWANGGLTSAVPTMRGFDLFKPYAVGITGQTLKIVGDSATLTRDAKTGKLQLGGAFTMALVIDLGSADPEDVLPRLEPLLFFSDATTARERLPAWIQRVVDRGLKGDSGEDCHCARVLEDGKITEVPLTGHTFKHPELVKKVDLSLTDEARRAHVNGTNELELFVGVDGMVGDSWLLKSLGYGLDQEAGRSVRAYRFKPAIYDGTSVATELLIKTSFQQY